MSKEESSLTNSRDLLAKLADLYAEKPYIRAFFMFATGVVGFFPGVSALTDTIRELIASGVDDMTCAKEGNKIVVCSQLT